jgi:hypothetical protein
MRTPFVNLKVWTEWTCCPGWLTGHATTPYNDQTAGVLEQSAIYANLYAWRGARMFCQLRQHVARFAGGVCQEDANVAYL